MGTRLVRDDIRAQLLRPHRQVAAAGAVLAAIGGALVGLLEPRPWIESLFGWLAITGLVCATAVLVEPWRTHRQRRWARLAERGSAPDWAVVVPRLRRARRTAWVLLLLAWLCAAIGIRSAAAVTERYERLVERAVEVQGEVIDVEYPSRGIDWMEVAFTLDGVEHEVRIADIPDRFDLGDRITVLVDPADPDGATVAGVERSTLLDRGVQTFAILLCLILVPLGGLGIHRASIAGDALLATGLRRTDAWWSSTRHGHRLRRPGGRGRGITVGDAVLTSRSLSSVDGPVAVAGPGRGPLVLVDPEGLVGTVRRPLLPPWDLRRLLG